MPRWTWKPVTDSRTPGVALYSGASAEQPAELVDALLVDQRRAQPIARAQGALDDQLALGDEQPVGRLPPGTQLQVGQRAVVGDPRVVWVGDAQCGHKGILPTGRRPL
nr:hypothetical protein GCM10020092_083310 [Actinoplanes digitatis]